MVVEILNKIEHLNESDLQKIQIAILSKLKLLARKKRLENQLKKFT